MWASLFLKEVHFCYEMNIHNASELPRTKCVKEVSSWDDVTCMVVGIASYQSQGEWCWVHGSGNLSSN